MEIQSSPVKLEVSNEALFIIEDEESMNILPVPMMELLMKKDFE